MAVDGQAIKDDSRLCLLTCKEQSVFQSELKKSLLNHYKSVIFHAIQPQMGGFIDRESVSLSILSSHIVAKEDIYIKCSVFYAERVGGCNCHDDPYAENACCEMQLLWNKAGLTIL